MSNKIRPKRGFENGFIATIAVIMLAFSILAIIVVVANATNAYADSVYLRGLRVYARENISSCLSEAENVLSRDFFWRGEKDFLDSNCEADVETAGNPVNEVTLTAIVKVNRVLMTAKEVVYLEDFDINVVSREVTD